MIRMMFGLFLEAEQVLTLVNDAPAITAKPADLINNKQNKGNIIKGEIIGVILLSSDPRTLLFLERKTVTTMFKVFGY